VVQGAAMTNDAETQRLIGTMNANIVAIMKKQEDMELKLDAVVAMTNRWKGATTLLIFIGGLIGWATNLLFKGHA
jgi:hypothetical protein